MPKDFGKIGSIKVDNSVWTMNYTTKEELLKEIIICMGDNHDREGLKETPARVIKMWKEIYKGYDISQKPKVTVFNNNGDGIKYDQMIVDTGYFYSTCEHHMIPFFGSYYFAYIPNKKVLGLSKVARIVDYFSAKLQIQERLGKEIVDELEKELKPKAIGLVLKARHLCKEMRGVRKIEGEMITSDLRGLFRTEPETRAEFMSLVNSK